MYQHNKIQGVIKGRVYNSKTNEGVPFATIQIWGTTIGAVTDFEGNYSLSGIKPGFVELRVSSIGFKPFISAALMVTNSHQENLDISFGRSRDKYRRGSDQGFPFHQKDRNTCLCQDNRYR